MLLALSCSSEEPSLERRGGPSPVGPVQDPPLPGAGGESGAGGAGAAETPITFCDALVVVRDKCQRCHGDPLQNGAPVPFLTYEDTQGSYYDDATRKWWQAMEMSVATNFMPFTGFNDPPTSLMPPVVPLTAEERATLLGWLTQGALPEGGTDCAATP